MRPLHLQLAATILLAVSVCLIARQSGQPGKDAGTPASARLATKSARRSGHAATVGHRQPHARILTDGCAPHGMEPAVRAPAHNFPASPVVGRDSETALTPPRSLPNNEAQAIQLSDYVQLPAALMPQDGPETDAELTVPAAVVAANREIANTFYQKIAASPIVRPATGEKPVDAHPVTPVTVSANDSPTPSSDNPTPSGGDTTVIPPGPDVEQAREIANETYRTLFGDEAYNRQTMNSAIEVHLPANTSQP